MTHALFATPGAPVEVIAPYARWVPPAVVDDGPALLAYAFLLTAGAVVVFVILSNASYRLWGSISRRLIGTWQAGLAFAAVIAALAYVQFSGRVEFVALYRDGLDSLDEGPAEFGAALIAWVLGLFVVTAGLAAVWGLVRWCAIIIAK